MPKLTIEITEKEFEELRTKLKEVGGHDAPLSDSDEIESFNNTINETSIFKADVKSSICAFYEIYSSSPEDLIQKAFNLSEDEEG